MSRNRITLVRCRVSFAVCYGVQKIVTIVTLTTDYSLEIGGSVQSVSRVGERTRRVASASWVISTGFRAT